MKPNLIVSDWNGTLIKDKDDKPVLKQIAMDELAYALTHLKLGRAWQLAQTKKYLEAMVRQYKDDPQSQAELLKATYDLYNREVINGMPEEKVKHSVEKYGIEAWHRLDFYVLNALLRCRESKKGILTSAFCDGVVAALRELERRFNFINASEMQMNPDGTAKEINLRNYDDKIDTLKGILEEMRVNSDDVVYMGDDFRDEPCAEIAGRFVVAPLATDEYRQHMASKYGSKVRTPERGEVYEALTMD